jgi:hypothetical protein
VPTSSVGSGSPAGVKSPGSPSFGAIELSTAPRNNRARKLHPNKKTEMFPPTRAIPYSPQRKREKAIRAAPSDLPLGSRALFWAMAQLRNGLVARPSISPARRAAILGALGPAVHRALRRGRVRTRGELARLVGFLLARLEERRGLGLDLPATRRWAEWAVREALRAIEEERERREAGEKFIRELLREAEEARRAWEELLESGGTFPAVLRQDNRGDEPDPRREGEAPFRAFELGAGLPAEIPSRGAGRASGPVELSGTGSLWPPRMLLRREDTVEREPRSTC